MSGAALHPLTVCMISGAEARRIGPALASVTGWAAEIIVVLNEDARDGTEELCRAAGARVFREPWKGHVSQKNSAADKATQPWLLGLDADEELTPRLRAEIGAALASAKGGSGPAAYSIPRLSEYAGRWIRHGDWRPDRKTRLWRRGRARWEGEDPHDRLVVNGVTARLRCDLLHRPMESIDHQIRKTIAYADDFARISRQQGRRVTLVDLAVRPWWRFFRCYILRLGFLDGWQGYSIAWMTAFYTFVRYFKVKAAQEVRPTGG